MQTKICNECKIEKNVTEYYKDKCCVYGVRSKCKECERKIKQIRYQENKERIIQNNKQWKEKIKQNLTLPFWNMRATKINERCQRHDVCGIITGQELKDIFEYQNGKCFYCGDTLDADFHIDHITPISKNGFNNSDNIAITCTFCNLHKSDNMFDEEKFFDFVKRNYYRLRDKYETTDNPVGKTDDITIQND